MLPDTETIAVLRSLKESNVLKFVPVPKGQSLGLDDNARRPWLHEHLGSEWCLAEFVKVETLEKVLPYTMFEM